MLEIDIISKRGGFLAHYEAYLTGAVTGIVGPSGAGKTSLLRALAGLDRPMRGRIALFDEVLFDSQDGIDVPTHKRGMAVLFQDVRLFPHLNVRGNLEFAQPQRRQATSRMALQRVAEDLNIADLLDRSVAGLSGGEAKRVALARAVLMHPRLLLLDEPFVGLDAEARRATFAFLHKLSDEEGLLILCVTHLVNELNLLADERLEIEDGRCRTRRTRLKTA